MVSISVLIVFDIWSFSSIYLEGKKREKVVIYWAFRIIKILTTIYAGGNSAPKYRGGGANLVLQTKVIRREKRKISSSQKTDRIPRVRVEENSGWSKCSHIYLSPLIVLVIVLVVIVLVLLRLAVGLLLLLQLTDRLQLHLELADGAVDLLLARNERKIGKERER